MTPINTDDGGWWVVMQQSSATHSNSKGSGLGQNLHDWWYNVPVVLPNIGRSDHRAVVMSASVNVKRERRQDVMVVRRSQDSNGKAQLAQALKNVNWTSLYNMQSCEEMVACFYSTVTSLLDHHLPPLTVKLHTTDKPWVTDQFRRLIQCRQCALRSGDTAMFKRLINQVQRLTKQLRQKYYEKKVNGLRTSNPSNWWRAVKQIIGLKQKSAEPLVGLAHRIQDGDVHALAGSTNKFF